jgi:hypothetical protein
MIVPGFGDETNGAGLGLERGLKARIVGDRPARLVMPKAVNVAQARLCSLLKSWVSVGLAPG